MKAVRFLLPTGGAVLLRLAQLATLFVLAESDRNGDRDLLVAGFGVLASFAILTDSGAANFLLSARDRLLARPEYFRVLGLHAVLSTAGSALALLLIGSGSHWSLGGEAFAVLASLATAQALDGTARSAKAPLLRAGQDARYAAPDLVLFLLKGSVIAACIVTASTQWLYALPLVSAFVAVTTVMFAARVLPPARQRSNHLYRRVLEFGVTGALSAFYSQSPVLLGTLLMPVSQVAALTVVYRLVQPLEIVPGTISQQLIPRFKNRTNGPLFYWAWFAVGGAITAVALAVGGEFLRGLFNDAFAPWVLLIVLMSVPLKWGNYVLVAFVMAIGRIRQRLVLTVLVGLAAIILCISLQASAVTIVWVTVISEALLATGFVAIFGRPQAAGASR